MRVVKQENWQKWKVNSNFLSTVNDLKNVWHLRSIKDIIIEQCPSCLLNLVKFQFGGGCKLAAITRCKCAWGKFRQLLPLLTNRHLPLLTRGKVYSACVRSVMLHAAETWAMKVDTLNRLRGNDRAMIRWICNVRAKDEVSSSHKAWHPGLRCGAPHQ